MRYSEYATERNTEAQRQFDEKMKAVERNNAVDEVLSAIDDETALEIVGAFKPWEADIDVTADERVQYNGKLYRVVQSHRTQAGWEPDRTPALFTEVAKPGEIPVWKQPTGAQDAYQTGDKVHYPDENGPVYVSTVDDNVWAPDVYGWTPENE